MSATDVIELLDGISFGTVLKVVCVIVFFIGIICMICIKGYKIAEKYFQLKKENEMAKTKIEYHDQQLDLILSRLDKIQNTLDKQDEYSFKQLRHTLVKTLTEALVKGTITVREYKSVHELYQDYHDNKHGNSYVTSLIEKVDREVEVIGKLDEDGYDID